MTATWVTGPVVLTVDHGPPLAGGRRHGQLLQGVVFVAIVGAVHDRDPDCQTRWCWRL